MLLSCANCRPVSEYFCPQWKKRSYWFVAVCSMCFCRCVHLSWSGPVLCPACLHQCVCVCVRGNLLCQGYLTLRWHHALTVVLTVAWLIISGVCS